MSLNWKEINLILEELDLKGAQIQSAVQSAYDVIILRFHKKGETKQILVSLSSGACRLHETFRAVPKNDKPLRFAQFLSSKIVNGWVTEINQLDDNRIVRIVIKRAGEESIAYTLYIRLWSNAANFIVTDENGVILDAMRRNPKRGEITGGQYKPEEDLPRSTQREEEKNKKPKKEFFIREIQGEGSFNKKIDEFYAEQGGALSLEALREQARKSYEGSLGRLASSIEKLKEKEASFADGEKLKNYGDLILSNMSNIKSGDKWLEVEEDGNIVRIGLEERVTPSLMAQKYYEQYRKAKSGIADIQREIEQGEKEYKEVSEKLEKLLAETNPLILAKMLRSAKPNQKGASSNLLSKKEKTRPGLSFKRGDWLIIVGRDANENDELLRRHVKGNDLWLHARDYHGSYVFIKQRAGKSVPLEILLDAGNLAIFYSKGRNNGAGDLFYTQAKYLRRAKDGPKGLVIPTQEKNLHVKLEDERLRSLENCRV
ncbi:MAG: NFACT family protein [Treponema sp.]|nr:NFACT family protein [Treponema sp.]MCL2238214.1 NFACT family protein [Treponema sp.]